MNALLRGEKVEILSLISLQEGKNTMVIIYSLGKKIFLLLRVYTALMMNYPTHFQLKASLKSI